MDFKKRYNQNVKKIDNFFNAIINSFFIYANTFLVAIFGSYWVQ